MGSIFANALFLSKEWKWNKNLDKASVFVDSSGKIKTFQVSKYTKVCSNNFEYGEAAPNPTLFLKGYDDDANVGVKKLQLQEKSHQLERK